MVKFLVNWTHEADGPGGSERTHSLLHRAFPEAELLSASRLAPNASIHDMRLAVDSFLSRNTSSSDIVIKDAGVGGIENIPAKTVLYFENPYYSLAESMNNDELIPIWLSLVEAQRMDAKKSILNIASAEFSRVDAEASGCRIDLVVNGGADMDFWLPPSEEKVEPYIIWVGSRFKEKYSVVDLDSLPLYRVYKEDAHDISSMRRHYHGASCLLYTFPIEGIPHVILEALACGLPVITTRSGWFWDKPVDEVGVFIPDNKEDLVGVIDKVIAERDSFDTREYLFKNKLTMNDFISNMREAVKEFI